MLALGGVAQIEKEAEDAKTEFWMGIVGPIASVIIGSALIILGILRFFGGGGFGGLWLVFIGWFLLDAARASRAYLETSENLRGVRVADVMTPNCLVVDSRDNLQTFALTRASLSQRRWK